MKPNNTLGLKLLVFIPVLLFFSACSAGDTQFSQETPAGFWFGLWHGIISFITLFIHIFNESVVVYEVNNTGGWYDFGFLIGVISIWGGGSHVSCKSSAQKKHDKEWEEIGEKVEAKVLRELKEWVKDEEITQSADQCEDLGQKVEQKLKRKIREWAEKE